MKEYEACDEILQLLIDNPSEMFDDRKIHQTLFSEMPLDIITHFYKAIINFPATHPIMTYHNYGNGGIKNTSFTKIFLDQGGFTGLHNKQKEEIEKHDKKESLSAAKMQLEIDDLVNKLIDYNKVKSQAKWAIIISTLTLIATILLGVF